MLCGFQLKVFLHFFEKLVMYSVYTIFYKHSLTERFFRLLSHFFHIQKKFV